MKSNPRAGIILPVIVLLGLVLIPAGILLSDQSIERISARTAHAAMESGNFEVAVAEYMKAAAYASEGALYWDEIGQAALSAGDPGTAVHYLEKAMGYGGFAPEDWASLGQAYFNLGDIKQAAEALDRANNESDPQPEIVGQLLEIHSILGDDEAVVRDLSQLVELEPENLEAQLQLGLLLAALNPEEAIAVLGQMAEGAEERSEIYRELALEIRRARAISSDPEFINLSAGQALANAGEWEMARLAFEKAIEINPAYGEAWAYLGAAENELGISGRESLNVAYSLDPDSLAVNLLMALHLQSNGDPQQALLHLNKARLSDPENPTLVAEMASIVASEGDISGALNLFDEAIRMAPEDALYWKIQSNFSIQNEVQIEEIGLPSARQATLLSPRDPEAFDLLGQAYFAVGNPLLAERFLIYAVSLDQEFASARYHLGVLYLTLGSVDQAREQLELVMAMAPETPLAEQASSLIRIYLQ